MLQAGRSRDRIPIRWIFFFNLPNPSSRTMALGSTQPLTEMSTRNLPRGKGRPARKADLTAICEPIVQKMWEPQHLTTIWASTACYRDTFTFLLYTAVCAPSAGVYVLSIEVCAPCTALCAPSTAWHGSNGQGIIDVPHCNSCSLNTFGVENISCVLE
jgi:hypothetical protein